ncbi:hypothetical protein, conserved [Leishmania tarentolae]|uniref:Uncharacterized protein n=1 Tax=Leishmania tarentolae TaxID=5689 RepID=A0A640KQ96_LEITA|nr:hypothetical protein, conserved [Leishmania tarentolae]
MGGCAAALLYSNLVPILPLTCSTTVYFLSSTSLQTCNIVSSLCVFSTIAFHSGTPVNSVAAIIEDRTKDCWSLHMADSGVPPTIASTLSWGFLSFVAAVLFLEVRPAASRRVRASAVHEGCEIVDSVKRSTHICWTWRLLVAVWTCAIYDVVYRTCSYCVLSPHMLARRRLLPLGNDFVWDGLWTEWVNWVRLYVLCVPSATTSAAAQLPSCADWKLPLAGVLAYEQYANYALLNVSSPATPSEVRIHHRVCLASLAITWVTVLALHGQYSFLRRIFSVAASSTVRKPRNVIANEQARSREEQAKCIPNFTTAVDAAEAPGDDSWVDSPEAIAEEERWRQEEDLLRLQRASTREGGMSADTFASTTTHLVWQCWPSLATAAYATLYACVGGLPLFMNLLFPAAILVISVMAIVATL